MADRRPPGRRLRAVRVIGLALVVALVGVACGAGGSSPDDGTLHVVATTTIFADMVRQVGGARVSVESLVPKGGEVHTFDPRPSSIRRVAEARLIFLNGLGLDDWLANLVEDAGTNAPVVRLAEDLPGATLIAGEGGGGTVNPHLWMNITYGALYADRIAQALATADPAGATAYAAGLAAYRVRLAALDAWAAAEVDAVPEASRTVVAFHDAFPYFAAAYGLTIDGTIVNAPGQDPSAGSVADLVAVIRAKHVRAIFAEAQFSEDLVRTIANETGATVVSSLYTDSVGDAPKDTYEGMMRWNVEQVVAALKG
ncbi:MAG: metal ABC transporter substrate-binding protein [Candidatus Limnocylindrales bacterium]